MIFVLLPLGRHGQSAPYIFIYIHAILPAHHHPPLDPTEKGSEQIALSASSFVAHIDDGYSVYIYIYIHTHTDT